MPPPSPTSTGGDAQSGMKRPVAMKVILACAERTSWFSVPTSEAIPFQPPQLPTTSTSPSHHCSSSHHCPSRSHRASPPAATTRAPYHSPSRSSTVDPSPMGGKHEPEADGGKAGGYSSSGLPPSEPPHLQGQPPQEYGYGTFQGPRQPPVGFPQPAPPPGFGGGGGGYHNQQQPYAPAEPYFAQGYQAVPGYGTVAEGRPVRMRRLPCCGLGLGWCLFITGFFLAAIPWYIGAFVLICVRVHDQREKPGYVACTIAAVVAAIAILFGVTKGTHVW